MDQPSVSAPSLAARPLGEIAATLPGATGIFRRFKLDFCCGGGETLAVAATARGLDPAMVEAQLQALVPDTAPAPRQTADLIAHIVGRYHDAHRRDLPELRALARRVERVHAQHPACPTGLEAFLSGLEEDLLSHMEREEVVLFPLMRQGGHPMLLLPIERMRDEHVEHGRGLARLAEIAHDFEPPADACGTWRALYTGLRSLSDDLVEHIHLENNVLFPRFTD